MSPTMLFSNRPPSGTRSFRRLRWNVTGLVLGALGLFALPLSAQVPGDPGPPGGVMVDSIEVTGTVNLEPAAVLGTVGLQPGTQLTFMDVQRAIKALWATGLFRDIQVDAREGADEQVILAFRVEEQDVIQRLEIRGLESLNVGSVRDTLDLSTGQPYSPERIRQAERYIQEELSRRGIPFSRVEERVEPLPDQPGMVSLILDVTEGHRVTVADVAFRGNETFSDGELRGVLDTRREGFLWFRDGSYDVEVFREDLASRLPNFYASHGYLDFQVVHDTLVVDDVTGKARVEVEIQEGPQYRLAELNIEGNRRFPTTDLEPYYQMEEGGLLSRFGIRRGAADEGTPVFDRVAFEDAAQQVEQRYRNSGYLYAQVQPDIVRQPGENGRPPTVSATWRIQEGQPAYVNRIDIVGNEFTHDRVIREQVVMLPGDVYSEDRLLRSYQAISGLGFFETPLPFPQISPDPETGDVDITFEVEEQQTGSINFGTAMGGGTGISGFLGWDQPNLFGQAKSGSVRWDFGRYQNSFTTTYSDPALFQSRVSGSISLFSARDRFFRFATGQQKRTGGELRVGVPVPGARWTRMYLGYSLSRTDFRLQAGADDTSLFGRPPGTQSTLLMGLTRQTLDHPLFPTTGSRQSLNTEVSGGIMGGDGDFVKQVAEASWWVPVGQVGGGGPGSRPVSFTLGLHLNGGAILGDADRFPFDRFWLGGVQFGRSLRGYEETTLTPQGHFPRGSDQIFDIDRLGDAFFKVSAEYAVRISNQFSVSLFYDAGGIWQDPFQVDPSRLFRGAGIGAKVVTPFGPIGLDYAYGFDREPAGWKFHFSMGDGGMF